MERCLNNSENNYVKIFGGSVVISAICLCFSSVFSCNDTYGLGRYTADGACFNYIYGYSFIGGILDLLSPILLSFGFSYWLSRKKLMSAVVSIVSVGVAVALIALVNPLLVR